MSVIPEFFLNAVVSIGELRNNVISWFGTGFFVTRKVTSERSQPFLVTNRHVLENRSSIIIRLKNKDDTFLKEIPVSLVNNGEKLYQCHPNSKIDIAVLLLNGNFITENKLDFQSFDIDEHALTSYELRSEGVNEGTLIYMLGYPIREQAFIKFIKYIALDVFTANFFIFTSSFIRSCCATIR